MVVVERVGGREVGDQRALRLDDAHSAGARGLLWVLHVVHVHAVLLGTLLELLGMVVLADGAEERRGRLVVLVQHPLRHADGVLRGTAGHEHWLVLGGDVRVQWQVGLLCEDGVVELETVLVQQRLVDIGADVQQWVAQADDAQRQVVVVLRGAHGARWS